MRERSRFEQEMRALGIRSGSDKEIGLMSRSPARKTFNGVAEREFGYNRSYEFSVEISDFQTEAKVPAAAIDKLKSSTLFKTLSSKIDKAYVTVNQLINSGQPMDMNDDGRLTKAKGSFKGKRALKFQPGSATEFLAARTVDNQATADIVNIDTPSETDAKRLEKAWVMRLVCMTAQVHNEATASRKKSASLSARIDARLDEQRKVRLMIDEVLRDIDLRNKDYNIGLLFQNEFKTRKGIFEIGYYPGDLLINGSFILTNLEQCALFEFIQESRRQQGLKDTEVDASITKIQTKLSGISDADLTKHFETLKPTFSKDKDHKDDFIASDLETFLFARGLMHRRWRKLLFSTSNPVFDSDTWKKNSDMSDMRREHAEKIFPKSVSYSLSL
jgi:hypothetical protein